MGSLVASRKSALDSWANRSPKDCWQLLRSSKIHLWGPLLPSDKEPASVLCFHEAKPCRKFHGYFSLSTFESTSHLGTNSRKFLPLQLPGKQTYGQRACSLLSLRLQRCQRLQQTQCLKREKHHEMGILANGLSILLICC